MNPTATQIPEQLELPWRTVCRVSWAGVRRRLSRSLVTLSCVALAVAFVAYLLLLDQIIAALVSINDGELNAKLQKNGVDIYLGAGLDRMTILLLGLSLLTCTVGIANSMLMSVAERVREIGTLKCLGARDSFIVKTYLLEGILQGACGATLGIGIGFLTATAICWSEYGHPVWTHFPALPAIKSVAIALSCGLAISVIASIAPAYLAAQKDPVEALRVEE